MPELPDVEHFMTYLQATSLHHRIESISIKDREMLGDVSPRKLIHHLKHNEFDGARRHGKFLFCGLKDNGWLVLHFGMTGQLFYYKLSGNGKDGEPEHCRLLITFDNGYALAYDDQRRLGRIDYTEDMNSFIEKEGLGPDAANVSLKDFRRIVGDYRGSIKSLFLNQRRLAGLGNVYGDEVLFQAGVHPAAQADSLSEETIRNLHRQMKRVFRKAREVNADAASLPSSFLAPRRGEDETCPQGHGNLQRQTIAGRTAYLCPVCQNRRS